MSADEYVTVLDEVYRLATKMARQHQTVDHTRQQLREAIVAAKEQGFSTRRIAKAAGISQPRVMQIAKEIKNASKSQPPEPAPSGDSSQDSPPGQDLGPGAEHHQAIADGDAE